MKRNTTRLAQEAAEEEVLLERRDGGVDEDRLVAEDAQGQPGGSVFSIRAISLLTVSMILTVFVPD